MTPDCNNPFDIYDLHKIRRIVIQLRITCNYMDLGKATVIKLLNPLNIKHMNQDNIMVVTDQRFNGNFRYLGQKSN